MQDALARLSGWPDPFKTQWVSAFDRSLQSLFEMKDFGPFVALIPTDRADFLSKKAPMRITIAGLLFAIAPALVACEHETTVFHSLDGRSYFKAGSVAGVTPADTPAPSPSPAAAEAAPSR